MHHPDAVAIDVQLVQLAAGDQHRRPFLRQAAGQGIEVGLGADIQATTGLVQQQQARAVDHPLGHDHLLLIAAGELAYRWLKVVELGLQALIDEEDFHPRQALLRLKGERKLFDETVTDCDYPDLLEDNLEALGELLGLDAAELRILGFCVLMQTDPTLNNAADLLGMLGFNRMIAVLSALLEIPQLQLTRYLSNDGRLVRAGLLEVNTMSSAVTTLSSRLSVGNSDLPGLMRFNQDEPIELFKYAFRLSPPGTLQLDNYEHLRQHVGIAQAYLGKALAEGRPGVNILLYGPPGTGKTQLSRLLAKTLNTTLYEIACADSDGDPVSASQRLCALRSAMSVLHSQKSLLVLDEIEDIFDSPMPMGIGTRSKAQKGWINRMLEENTLPCFWLSNSVESLDAAHIRRFDLVIELPNPPRAQREQIVRNCSDNKLGNELVEKLVDHEHATPAVLTRAVRIARSRLAGEPADVLISPRLAQIERSIVTNREAILESAREVAEQTIRQMAGNAGGD